MIYPTVEVKRTPAAEADPYATPRNPTPISARLGRHNHSSWARPADEDDPRCAEAIENWRRKRNQGCIDACCKAVAELRPAEVAAGTAMLTETVGTNRRMRNASGGVMPLWGSGPIAIPGDRFAGAAAPDPKRITFLSARRMGEIAMVTAPAEMFSQFAEQIHQASPFKDLLLLSFDDRGWIGYVGTPIAYEQGGYEIGLQGYAPATEVKMIAAGAKTNWIGCARPDTGQEVTTNVLRVLNDLAN